MRKNPIKVGFRNEEEPNKGLDVVMRKNPAQNYN